MLQMTEAPTVHPYNGSSMLVPMFASSSVQVLREEEAFSFSDLVADCGGVLGLFVGFNFLMVWDWMAWCCRKCLEERFVIKCP